MLRSGWERQKQSVPPQSFHQKSIGLLSSDKHDHRTRSFGVNGMQDLDIARYVPLHSALTQTDSAPGRNSLLAGL